MNDKTQGLFFGVLGAVVAGIILWAVKSFFPTTVNWLFTPDVPSGAVMAFDVKNCGEVPGWDDFAEADGRFILGQTDIRDDWKFGERGGEAEHQLIKSEMPSHTHSGGFVGSGSSHAAHITGGGNLPQGRGVISSEGGNQPHNNMPRYIALTYCKKF